MCSAYIAYCAVREQYRNLLGLNYDSLLHLYLSRFEQSIKQKHPLIGISSYERVKQDFVLITHDSIMTVNLGHSIFNEVYRKGDAFCRITSSRRGDNHARRIKIDAYHL